jgi:hypothetical protein
MFSQILGGSKFRSSIIKPNQGESERASVARAASNGTLIAQVPSDRDGILPTLKNFHRTSSEGSLTDHEISLPTDSISSNSLSTQAEEETSVEKTLLSPANFEKAAGPVRMRHGRAYRNLRASLTKYETESATLAPAKKTALLIEIQEHAHSYYCEKAAVSERPSFLRSPFKAARESLDQRLTVAISLANEISKELFGFEAPITFSQKDEGRAEDNFAAGAMAEVAKIHYTNRPLPAFFKHVNAEDRMESEADKMAIPRESTLVANLAGRAVATYTVSKLLDWENLVPETGFATHNHQIGYCQTSAQGEPLRKEKWEDIRTDTITPSSPVFSAFETALDPNIPESDKNFSFTFSSDSPATVNAWIKEWIEQNPKPASQEEQRKWATDMKKAVITAFFVTGKITASQKVFSASQVDFANPQLQKMLSKAHLIDLLTGQLDRNAGNFFYTQAGESWDAALIDNDLSFPEKFDSFEKEKFDLFNPGKKFPNALPDLIDGAAARAIAGLTEANLTSTLQTTGLTDLEIGATLKRLELLKIYIAQAKGNISPAVPRLLTEWNQETFEAQQHTPNNYIWMGCEAKKDITSLTKFSVT